MSRLRRGYLATSDSWLSSFQDQNQGTRNDAAHAKVRLVATVLFHPDFNRRLRNYTESADPCFQPTRRSRALGLATLTAGGDFHPALRTSAARYGQPVPTMPGRHRCSKRDSLQRWACPP